MDTRTIRTRRAQLSRQIFHAAFMAAVTSIKQSAKQAGIIMLIVIISCILEP